jgi:hypothetical protein
MTQSPEMQQTQRAERARRRMPWGFGLIALGIVIVFAIGFTLKLVL